MIDSRQKGNDSVKVIHLLLNEESASLVSPFYKHTIQYVPMEGESERYRLIEWSSTKFRIKKNKDRSESSYAQALRDIIRNSFFPLLVKTSVVSPWQKKLFPWDTHHRGLSTRFRPEFLLEEWLSSERCSLGKTEYWKLYRELYKDVLDPIIKSLQINRETVVENSMAGLFGLLDEWKTQPHFTGYLRNRVMEMEKLQSLSQSGLARILPMSQYNYVDISDLEQLQIWLKSLGQDDILESTPPKFQNQERLILFTLGQGKFCQILKHFLLHQSKLEPFTKREIRQLIIERLIVPALKKSMESDALRCRSTFKPVSRKDLHFYYRKIFQIQSIEIPNQESSTDESDMVEESEYRGDLLDFEEKDTPEFLAYSINILRKDCGQDSDWEALDSARNNAPLFLIKKKPKFNEMEEVIRKIWCESLEPSEFRVVTTDLDVSEWQQNFLMMDEIDSGLYQIRFSLVPLTLSDQKEEKDLTLLQKMMEENIFQVSVIHPNDSAFSRGRLKTFIENRGERGKTEITKKDLKSRFFSTQKLTTNTGRPKPLLLIVDAHLLPIQELRNLLTFLEKRKNVVKRVVFFGALHLLNLDSDGQAFLDLIQWKEPTFLKTRLFQYDSLRAETMGMIDEMRESGRMKFTTLSQLDSTLTSYKRVVLLIVNPSESQKELDFLHEYLSSERRHLKTCLMENLTNKKWKQGTLFVLKKSEALKFSRNQMNHLLIHTQHLLMIQDCDLSKKISLKMERFPNFRYTLPYVLNNH